MSQFHPDSSVVERVEPSPNFDERPGLGRAGHDRAALHRHAVLRTRHPPAVRSEGPRLVALCGAGKRLDRPARAGEPSAPGTPACRPGPAIPTSTRAPSASRSAIPATISAIRIFRRGRSRRRSRCAAAILTRNIIRPENVAGAFRRGAEPQAGPRREISLEAVGAIRRRSLGRCRRRRRAASRSSPTTPARRSPSCRRCWPNTATASTPPAATTSPPREVVTAFQRHFRPAQVDGIADAATLQTLRKLADRPRRPAAEAAIAKPDRRIRRTICACLLTAAAARPIPSPSVGWTAAPAITERWPGRKVRAPWTNGAG